MAGTLWAELAAQKGNSQNIVWREIRALANDPDQPWNPRLQMMNDCGFGLAGAVPFSVLGEEGIVVFITRELEEINIDKLTSVTNEAYLWSSAQLIGSAFVFRGPRNEAAQETSRQHDSALDWSLHAISDTSVCRLCRGQTLSVSRSRRYHSLGRYQFTGRLVQ